LIQKYEKSLGFGFGLDHKVLFTSLQIKIPGKAVN